MAKLINGLTGKDLWRTCKFLCNDNQIDQACAKILEMLPPASSQLLFPAGDWEDDLKLRSFKATYGGVITKRINGKRSETQGGIRTEYLARYKKGRPMPDVSTLQMVICRQGLTEGRMISKKTLEKNREIFEWYWDKLLPKVAGKDHWAKNKRY